jgi:hypothetical protein
MSIRLHAPGPWTVDYTDDNLRIYAGDRLIAEVNGSAEHIEIRGLDEETTEANAWLIAGGAPTNVRPISLAIHSSRFWLTSSSNCSADRDFQHQ